VSEPELGRAFVAVVPPDDVLDAVGGAAATMEVPSTARCTTRPQWHLTLQFLGNRVDFAAVAGALEALAVRGSAVQLGAAGAFPTERRGRVLWLGVSQGAELLVQLAAAVGALLEPVGYPPEARAYHAHLTLARLKAPADLSSPRSGRARWGGRGRPRRSCCSRARRDEAAPSTRSGLGSRSGSDPAKALHRTGVRAKLHACRSGDAGWHQA
jgi:2'-5' RNA ligase